MKIRYILGFCGLAMLVLHSSLLGAVQKSNEEKRWTQPKPPEYGPKWQLPERMQKGQSSQTGSDGQEFQQSQQLMKSGSGSGGFAPSSSSMKMQTVPVTTMPKVQVTPTVGTSTLPRTQPTPAVAPGRQPAVSVPGIAR